MLASNLTQTETARIATYLGIRIPYKLADRDTAVLVPRSERYGLLNVLSEQELLTDQSNGFELLNESGLANQPSLNVKNMIVP